MGLGRSLERRVPALVGLCRPIRIEKSGQERRHDAVASVSVGRRVGCAPIGATSY